MSQDGKTGPAFWRLYYAFCNTICTSSPSTIHCAGRLSSFCFCCVQCAFNVRYVDLGPQQMTFRHRRRCCRPVPGCLVVASLAELLAWWAFSAPSGTCSASNTLSQFLTDLFRHFVILRRHEHGRPVSRSESDLQGPNLGGRFPSQRILGANPYLPSVPLGIAIPSRRMPGTEIEQDFTRIRRST